MDSTRNRFKILDIKCPRKKVTVPANDIQRMKIKREGRKLIPCAHPYFVSPFLRMRFKRFRQPDIRSNQKLIYRDETTGLERHVLSPTFLANGIEFILTIIPPLQETGSFPSHKRGVKEYIYVAQGKLKIELGDQPEIYILEKGDSIYFEADLKHRFINLLNTECHYYLLIDSHRINMYSFPI
jgi:quercetin dioxygenase-like cupin family protein